MPATMVWKISTCFDRLGGSEQVSILFPGAEAPEYLQQLRRRPEGRLYPNIDLFRVSLGMHRVLGLGSYKTAWTWLHKLRRAMVRPGHDRLSGTIEVDETYIAGPEEGARGRQTETKALVVIAAEEDGAGIGRIRMRRIADASAESLLPFVEEAVE